MTTLETSFKTIPATNVVDNAIELKEYIAINLSITNTDLSTLDPKNPEEYSHYINNYLLQKKAKIAFGGYNEVRNLYKNSTIFNNSSTDERNIHIGLDIWIKAGTKILAALDGTIHSFKNNLGLGNYGPTIILKHEFDGHVFYTLYGHLSLSSIENLDIGKPFKKGEIIAILGDSDCNGNYAPHLHFQIIKNIENYYGDYPGVCSKKDLNYYLNNCPNPNLLLKIF